MIRGPGAFDKARNLRRLGRTSVKSLNIKLLRAIRQENSEHSRSSREGSSFGGSLLRFYFS
jgi:hypothetical protein